MKLSKITLALSLLEGYCSMERADEAAHTQRVAEQLISGTAPVATTQVGPAVQRDSRSISPPGTQLVPNLNGDHLAINIIDDSSPLTGSPADLRPSGLEEGARAQIPAPHRRCCLFRFAPVDNTGCIATI
ncbi:hypothetical protein PGT21_006645 [Puccinia graminis f. sp. tritici]|uniref:Uncharacterized protein n=1 Tax=Puccinia graminis f. sp. tritici TaxID=56615 RepID=A0A5B0LMS5_PUCGR|nr:hypothetical protein PGT21_006645 [Puccinia graminis f. sp. tritici]